MESLGFSIYSIISSAYNDSFTSSFLIWIPIISCLINVAGTSDTMLKRRNESEHPYLVPDFSGNVFSFSSFSILLGLSLL